MENAETYQLLEYLKQDLEYHKRLLKSDKRKLFWAKVGAIAIACALLLMVAGGWYTIQTIKAEHKAQLAILKAYMEKKTCAGVQKLFTLTDHR